MPQLVLYTRMRAIHNNLLRLWGVMLSDGRYGSLAVIRTDSSPMAALGWKADAQPGRMSALTDTGHSERLRQTDLNGS